MTLPAPDDADLETLLLAARHEAPPPVLRGRVLAAMERAAAERQAMLEGQRRPAPSRTARVRRVVPEAIAGAAAALVIVLAAFTGGDAAGPDERGAVSPAGRSATVAEDPPDLHRALELLDARRGHFAALPDAAPSLPN